MNDIERAIRHFKNLKERNLVVLDNFKKEIETKKVIGNSNVHYSTSVYENRDKYLNTAIEALEKQIPKKVEIKRVLICPHCTNAYIDYLQKYCDSCGQKLDWF